MLGPKQHHNQHYLPGASSVEYLSCSKVDIHPGYERQTKRASYVNKGESCSIQAARRGFKDLGIIVVSFRFGQHEHTCSRLNDHYLPMRKEEVSFIILGLIRYDSAKAFYEKEFGSMLKRRLEIGQRMTRFDAMTISELERIARKCGIPNAPHQGLDNATRATAIAQNLLVAAKIEPFVRQVDNFDNRSFESVKASLLAEATSSRPNSECQSDESAAARAESIAMLQRADMSSFETKKKVKTTDDSSHTLPR